MRSKSVIKILKLSFLCLFQFTSFGPILAQTGSKREVRAVWIATVKNIDWPSSSDLSVDLQKHEATRLLELLRNAGVNTVFLQVRSSSDAIYAHSREPWAEWLTGTQGKSPSPFYDPLQFFIDEAHQRGMELQAWINPYRAIFDNIQSSISGSQISKVHPDWVFKYAGKTLLNPGIPAVREYIETVVLDLVSDYNIDGIHLDDYFYPYPQKGAFIPDKITFETYRGNFSNIEDWRRNNINLLIKEIGQKIKILKPYIKFGISPFGIWRNKSQDSTGSETSGGSSYQTQYADTRAWLQNGWVDYLVPQIYFTAENNRVPFKVLVDWWNRNRFSRQIFIGLGAYRIGEKKDGWSNPSQIPSQIRYSRLSGTIAGNALFSAHAFLINELGIVDSLKKGLYKNLAIPPTMPWISNSFPDSPTEVKIKKTDLGNEITWNAPKANSALDSTLYFLVYRFKKEEIQNLEDPKSLLSVVNGKTVYLDPIPSSNSGNNYVYLVSACNRIWNEGKPSIAIL